MGIAALLLTSALPTQVFAQDVVIDAYFDFYYPYYYGSYYTGSTYYWGYYPAYYSYVWPTYYTLYWDQPYYNNAYYYSYYPYFSYYNYYPSQQQTQYFYNTNFNPVCGDNVCSPGEDNYICAQDCRQLLTCSDGTPYGQCSPQQPKICNNGVLVDAAQTCGCGAGQIAQGSQCYQANPSCIVSVNPSTVRAGQNADVTVQYQQRSGNGMPTARVDCGNGQVAYAQCNGNSQTGTCGIVCNFDSQPYTPRYQQVNAQIDGRLCSDASVRVIDAVPTTGSVLARITDCDSHVPIGGALFRAISASRNVSVNALSVYSDQMGIAQLPGLPPAVYDFEVSANGYLNNRVSQQAYAGVANPVAVCLTKKTCDVTVSLVGSNGNRFDVLVENKLTTNAIGIVTTTTNTTTNATINTTTNVTTNTTVIVPRVIQLSYSGSFPVSGPSSVSLAAQQSQIVPITVNVPNDYAGQAIALVTAQGNSCTSQVQLQADASKGITLDSRNTSRNTLPGKKECFDVLVRNKGADRGTVTLSSYGPFTAQFDASQFQLSPYEARQVQYCVLVNDGASGYAQQQVSATSPMGSANASFTLYTPQQNDFRITNYNASICQPINLDQVAWTQEVKLQNNAFDSAFDVELQKPDELKAQISPSKLNAFSKGTTRSVYINFDNSATPLAGNYYVDLVLKKDGVTAWMGELCFSASAIDSATLQFSQPAIQLQRGTSKLAFAMLRNTGNYKRTFAISTNTTFQSISVTPTTITLAAGAETPVEIYINAVRGSPLGTSTIPFNVQAVSGTGQRTNAASANLVVDVTPEPALQNGTLAQVGALGGTNFGGLSGFFTLGGSEGALLLLIIFLAIAGGYLYYQANQNQKQLEAQAPSTSAAE
jgi:hypothetical protein